MISACRSSCSRIHHQPIRNRAYALVRKDGARFDGRSDGEGFVTLQQGMTLEGLVLEWLEHGDPA
ncbi:MULTISPECIES: hypothetical protein [unclassified Pseudomonas]|uniref:hypothetical protein n=1 Tax=unclassified Pseudomonas TaxID=196821 RepID=UPI000D38C751|nr:MULTISPECIES: hypothetical protein [unclassified Pseudomonas]PTR15276.1 hypothetical protein C8K63_1312 [Pseudomonas sp. GV085]